MELSLSDLTVLAFLEGRVLPESLGSPPLDEGGDLVEVLRTQASRSATSLVDSGTLSIVEGEAFLAPATRRVIQLICDPEWVTEGSSLYVDGGSVDFRLSGVGEEGVLVSCCIPGLVILSYRADARLALASVYLAMAGADRPTGTGPQDVYVEALSHAEVSHRPEWSSRRAHSVAVEAEGVLSDRRAVTWIVVGTETFVVEPTAEGPVYVAAGQVALDERLTELAAAMSGV